ncbi:MAG: serine/threonine protein kinase, partial [Candidatus Riflebacteria bacterium]|nr:serine/threonine protein kinase [Candidatus Riflebacteria bacterium]
MAEYKLINEIGRGAMGIVYTALQLPLERVVAVKLIRAVPAEDDELSKRFHLEMAACTKLVHPHIIKIFDSGVMDERLFFAMEYLADAASLREILDREGALPVSRAVGITLQLLDAIGYCHERSFVHRDLKPSNLMIGRDDHVTLMDFGLVRDLNRTPVTAPGVVLGAPRYRSPEMLQSLAVGPEADLWGAGTILYELLTGRPAFCTEAQEQLLSQIVLCQFIPASQA